MFRRKFLQLMTLASAHSVASIDSLAAEPTLTETYDVKGFSCITCAAGLDTMLCRQKGIKSSKSTYPAGVVSVCFHPDQITSHGIYGGTRHISPKNLRSTDVMNEQREAFAGVETRPTASDLRGLQPDEKERT